MSNLTKKQKEGLYTKNGKLLNSVKMAQMAYYGNGIFRPIQTGHRGGRGTFRDVSSNILGVIKILKYSYKRGNDAPRGGKSGDFIKVSKVAGNKIKSLK